VWEGDVRLFDPSEYTGVVDCIHAGFPCQDISVAGSQAGVGPETRSGLYREVLRIAGVVRPKQLFLENVAAIVTNGLETVLADLAALGYVSEWLCIRASDCGANHERDRWFLLAHSNGSQRKGRSVSSGGDEKHSDFGMGDWWKNKPTICGVDDGVPGRVHRLKGLGNAQVPLQAAAAYRLLGGQ